MWWMWDVCACPALCVACHICLAEEHGPGRVLMLLVACLIFPFPIFPLQLPLRVPLSSYPAGVNQFVRSLRTRARARAPCELCGDKLGQDGATCYPILCGSLKAKHLLQMPQMRAAAAPPPTTYCPGLTRWSYRSLPLHTPKMNEFGPKKIKVKK